MSFFLDNAPTNDKNIPNTRFVPYEEDEIAKHDLPPILSKLLECAHKAKQKYNDQQTPPKSTGTIKTKKNDPAVDGICEILTTKNKKTNAKIDIDCILNILKDETKTNVDKLLEKSIIQPGFETLEKVPSYRKGKRQLKKEKEIEKSKSKGKEWYNLPAPEITEEIKNDLEVLQMRSVLDPKHFYKKNDLKVLPKYFQVGKVVDSPLDYYNRCTKKEKKRTLVDELLADAEFQKYNKRKYKEIIEEKQKTHYKAYVKAKKLKRKNKK